MTQTQSAPGIRAAIEIVQAFHAVGLTRAKLGAKAWRETVGDAYRRRTLQGSRTGHQFLSRSMQSVEQMTEWYRAQVEINVARATPGELSRAAEPIPAPCRDCDGGAYVQNERGGQPVPCTACTTPDTRAALAGIPGRYRAASLETFHPRPGKAPALAWAATWDGKSAVLTGSWGTGKTHLGCALLRAVVESGERARYVSVPDMLDAIRATYDDGSRDQSQSVMTRLVAEPLLLLDDLGAERGTDWTEERMRMLLDARYRAERPTLVTTNLEGPRDMAQRYGGAVASRLSEWAWVPVGGADMRQEQIG